MFPSASHSGARRAAKRSDGGKIFVLPVENAVQVRTGMEGPEAV